MKYLLVLCFVFGAFSSVLAFDQNEPAKDDFQYSATIIMKKKQESGGVLYIADGHSLRYRELVVILKRLHKCSPKAPVTIIRSKDVEDKKVKSLMDFLSELGLLNITKLDYSDVVIDSNNQIKAGSDTGNDIATKVSKLVPDLGAKEYAVREDAERKLRQLPKTVKPILETYLKTAEDPEIVVRLRRLISHADKPNLPPVTIKELDKIIINELEFKNANWQDVTIFLAEETGIIISTDKHLPAQPITFRAKGISLRETLNVICEIAGVGYEITGTRIMIIQRRGRQHDFHPMDDPFAVRF